mmetsp:Transcript_69818/g.220380  ORF Transcript_69818/g.220380 Transcript_69818/m.220380 type:complete len:170 (+) Transcript_69818:220-729(+)
MASAGPSGFWRRGVLPVAAEVYGLHPRRWLDEHARLHGRCSLPQLGAAWSYVADVAEPRDGPAVAELVRHQRSPHEEPIERVSLAPTMAAVACDAVVASEAEEALLLRLSVPGCVDPVPVSMAVYNPALRLSGAVRVHRDVDLTSHRHLLTPPSTVTGLVSAADGFCAA